MYFLPYLTFPFYFVLFLFNLYLFLSFVPGHLSLSLQHYLLFEKIQDDIQININKYNTYVFGFVVLEKASAFG